MVIVKWWKCSNLMILILTMKTTTQKVGTFALLTPSRSSRKMVPHYRVGDLSIVSEENYGVSSYFFDTFSILFPKSSNISRQSYLISWPFIHILVLLFKNNFKLWQVVSIPNQTKKEYIDSQECASISFLFFNLIKITFYFINK